MDFEKYLEQLEFDKEIIFALQRKYQAFLREHMSKKKTERDCTWDKTRNMLFHVSGALSMAGSSFRSYIKKN